MRLVQAAVVALACALPSAALAQALTADVQLTADPADATALRAQVSRDEADLVSCLGASARGRSETVLWMSVAPTGAVTVSLALHRGPAEGVGPCIVERVRGWRLQAGARRRIEMVLRTGGSARPAPAPAPAPAPPASPSRPPTPAPSRPPTPAPSRPPTPATPASPARPPAPAPPASPAPAPVPTPPVAPSAGGGDEAPRELPDVTLTYGPPSVSGPYTRGEVQRVALLRRARLRRCYAEAVASEPTLAGEVVLAFRISTSGRAESVRRDESTLARPTLENCFVRAVRTWRFGERTDATAPTSVRLRLHLSPAAAAP